MIPKLFERLCDDAALFPPGNAPLDLAVAQHIEHRQSAHAAFVGPFVFPIPRLAELTEPSQFIQVSLTAPGGPDTVAAGLRLAESIPNVSVVAVEVAVPVGTDIGALGTIDPAVDVYVEIPRGERRAEIFDAVDERGYHAKFRTGGVTADAYPSEHELAGAIREAALREISFKATAGLHHAVRNTDPETGFEQHGYLNVLLAAQAAHSGARISEIETILALRDPDVLTTFIAAIETSRAFLSFGTCSIADPLNDLIGLGLITPPV